MQMSHPAKGFVQASMLNHGFKRQNDPISGDSASFLSSDFSMSNFLLIFVSDFEVMLSIKYRDFKTEQDSNPFIVG